jgi:hypothetical protein
MNKDKIIRRLLDLIQDLETEIKRLENLLEEKEISNENH